VSTARKSYLFVTLYQQSFVSFQDALTKYERADWHTCSVVMPTNNLVTLRHFAFKTLFRYFVDIGDIVPSFWATAVTRCHLSLKRTLILKRNRTS
jgi:hypothetical protein